jgi:hypothetical protein
MSVLRPCDLTGILPGFLNFRLVVFRLLFFLRISHRGRCMVDRTALKSSGIVAREFNGIAKTWSMA